MFRLVEVSQGEDKYGEGSGKMRTSLRRVAALCIRKSIAKYKIGPKYIVYLASAIELYYEALMSLIEVVVH